MMDWADRPPAASYDLHGQSVLEALKNAEGFLRSQAAARPGAVVQVVTGRGKSGSGATEAIRPPTQILKEQGALVRDYVLEEGEGSFLVRLRP